MRLTESGAGENPWEKQGDKWTAEGVRKGVFSEYEATQAQR